MSPQDKISATASMLEDKERVEKELRQQCQDLRQQHQKDQLIIQELRLIIQDNNSKNPEKTRK